MQLKFISDSDLVLQCKTGNREAWNEFFRRLRPLIKSSIRKALKQYDSSDEKSYYGLDAVGEITELLIFKLYPTGILDQLTNISGLRPWLKTVARNQTIEWLIAQGRLKHATRREIETGMLSLDTPLNQDTDSTLADTLADTQNIEIPGFQETLDYLEMLLQSVEDKPNRRDYWIVRLSIISQIPLEQSEEDSLVDFSPLPSTSARQLIQDMIEDVEQRTNECDAKLGLAISLGSELKRLQYLLWDMQCDDTPHGLAKFRQIQEECSKIEKRREKLSEDGQRIQRPRNAGIAALVGIAPKQESFVTTVLIRSREKLRNIPAPVWIDED